MFPSLLQLSHLFIPKIPDTNKELEPRPAPWSSWQRHLLPRYPNLEAASLTARDGNISLSSMLTKGDTAEGLSAAILIQMVLASVAHHWGLESASTKEH